MVLFSTKFVVSDDFSRSVFLSLLRRWISGLSGCSMDLVYQDESDYELSSDEGQYKIVIYSDEDYLAVQFTHKEDLAFHVSTYVLRKMDQFSVMFIRTEKFLSEMSMHVDLSYECPYVMQELFWREYGGMDHGLFTDDKPFLIRKNDVTFASDVLLSKIRFVNPVVYVSMNDAMGQSDYISYVHKLADCLTGVAHVVAEGNPYVASLVHERCYACTDRQAMGVGTIRILFPNGEQHDFSLDEADVIDKVFSYIYQAMCNMVIEDDFSFQKIRMQHLLSKVEADQEVSAICDELLSQKDSEIKTLQSDISRLKKELDATKRKSTSMEASLKKKSAKSDHQVSFVMNKETDYYDGECKDVVLKLIQKEYDQMTGDVKLEKSRKYHVLSDIVHSNLLSGNDEVVIKDFKRILESGTFNRGAKGELERLGFKVTKSGGNHYILAYNGDVRYSFSAASTPSDYRAGENLAASYMNMLFGY